MYLTYIVLDEDKPGRFISPFCTFLFQPAYIGKGTLRRVNHVNEIFEVRNSKRHSGKIFHNWLQNKKLLGRTNVPIIVLDANDELHAFAQEKILTDTFGLKIEGGILYNARPGGRGGWSLTNYTKQLLSEANKGENNPNWGRKWTEEQRKQWFETWNSKDRTPPKSQMENAWASKRRTYKITSPDKEYITDHLTNFCMDNKFPLSAFRKALKANGIVKSKLRPSSVEGWSIEYIN